MAFVYQNTTVFRNGKFNGIFAGSLLFDDLIDEAAPPLSGAVPVDLAIGNEVLISATIRATAGDDWINKEARLNIALFKDNAAASGATYWSAPVPAINNIIFATYYVGTNEIQHQKNVLITRVNNDDIVIAFIFRVTADLLDTIKGQNITNFDRFLKSTFNPANTILKNFAASAYKSATGGAMSIRVDVHDLDSVALIGSAKNPASNQKFLRVPTALRYYEAEVGGLVGRYMAKITATTPGQIGALLPPIADATKDTNFAFFPLDPQYTTAAASLSFLEDNSINIRIDGADAPGALINEATTTVRAILIRTDAISDTVYFIDDYQTSEGTVPAADPSATVIAGALSAPANWSDNLIAQQININFVIKAAELSPGGKYRIIINLYDDNNDRVSAHISPELVADYILPISPTITATLAEYCEEYVDDEILIAPGGRFKACINLDIQSYDAATSAAGYAGGLLDRLSEVRATFGGFGGFGAESVIFTPSPIPTGGATVAIDATTVAVCAVFRAPVAAGGDVVALDWSININQDDGNGGTAPVVVTYRQQINIKDFDDGSAGDVLLDTQFFEADGYPATKNPVSNICDADKIIVEVTKDVGAGDGVIIATLTETTATGSTVGVIEEEASEIPVYLPELTSTALDDVTNSAGGGAAYCVNVGDLKKDTIYFINTILRQKAPLISNYCPLLPAGGGGENLLYTERNGAGNWFGYGYAFTLFPYVALISLGNYTIIKNEFTDVLTGTPIGTNLVWGNPSSDNYRVYARFNSSVASVRYSYQIEFIYDAGDGDHVLRLTIDEILNRPPPGQSWIFVEVPFSCVDVTFANQ